MYEIANVKILEIYVTHLDISNLLKFVQIVKHVGTTKYYCNRGFAIVCTMNEVLFVLF